MQREAVKAWCQRVGPLLVFWILTGLVLFTPFRIQRWQQAAKPNDASSKALNVAATALARWQDNGLVSFSRDEGGVTIDLSQAASEWSAMRPPEQAAVWALCRERTWHGSPVTRCVIRDAAGRVLMDERAAAQN